MMLIYANIYRQMSPCQMTWTNNFKVFSVREADCIFAWRIAWINLICNTVAISALTLTMQDRLREEMKSKGSEIQKYSERLGPIEDDTLCNDPTWDEMSAHLAQCIRVQAGQADKRDLCQPGSMHRVLQQSCKVLMLLQRSSTSEPEPCDVTVAHHVI